MTSPNGILGEDLRAVVARPLPWSEFAGASVLVTGAAGFLPAYLVETLLHLNDAMGLGIRVLALVRSRERALRRFAAHRGRPDLTFLVQDVCRPLNIDGPVDYVVHAASLASPKHFASDPVGT